MQPVDREPDCATLLPEFDGESTFHGETLKNGKNEATHA
jgi:hypothetical protein